MTSLPRTTDLFVIGGGPAGLAAAIAARRRGLDVVLADCSVPPIDKACGEGIMPDGLAAARTLGLDLDLDLKAAGGHRFAGIRFVHRDTAVSARFPNGHGMGLRRTDLHSLMVDHAIDAGVRLAWGVRISGITPEGVMAGDRFVRARWIAGADGGHSPVRRWAGLDACHRESHRFGFRRHYRVAPWSEFMEVHWGETCQLYITPVSAEEVCVVLITRDQHQRLDHALPQFPELAGRLTAASATTLQRGGVTVSRRLKSVWRNNVALVGDASGSVDAITGEGLCLLFQQSVALAAALETGSLAEYQEAHRRIGRHPEFMADMMLLLDHRRLLRARAMRALAGSPAIFEKMLAIHTGEFSALNLIAAGLALGWEMLTV
ncbi:MAG: monooxygenase, FAD-binding [Candidatus Solibacter sp.]|jgi:flavin-dependent dehydrogenase|nr:monooxygenase, FAD-binding [Candidatus Solibacter sp.]